MKKKMKKKSKFPDHSGDGKITKKDILMAKGIIPKKKKKGKTQNLIDLDYDRLRLLEREVGSPH